MIIYVVVISTRRINQHLERKINVTHNRTINSKNWIKAKSMLINCLNQELSRANKTKKATKRTKKHFRAFYFLSEYTSVHTQRHSTDKNTPPCLPCGELSLIFFLHSKMHCAVITWKKNNPSRNFFVLKSIDNIFHIIKNSFDFEYLFEYISFC